MAIMATASSTGVMAYIFYIFLITGNFTMNDALKQSFNIMNLRFNFTSSSNKSPLINYKFFPNGWKTADVHAFVRFVLVREQLIFSLLEKINNLLEEICWK